MSTLLLNSYNPSRQLSLSSKKTGGKRREIKENAYLCGVEDCIDKLKTGPQQSLRPKKSKSKKLLTSQIEAKKI